MSEDLRDVSAFTTIARNEMVDGPRDLMAGPTRARAKVERVAERIISALDVLDVTSFFNASPHHDARVIMSILNSDPLTPECLQAVLDELKRRGRLGEFLHLLREDEIRDYLRMMRVPWTYVVRHWVPSAGDSREVLAGFTFGVGESAADVFVLIGSVIGSRIDGTFGKDAAQLWSQINQLFELIRKEGLTQVAGASFDAMLRDFEKAIYQRRFFDAGRQLGKFVGVIVPFLAALPGAAKARLAAVRSFAHLIDNLIEVSMDLVQYFRLELKLIYEGFENLGTLQPAFAMSGMQGSFEGGVMVLTSGDRAIGKLTRETFMMQADEVARQLSATGKTLAQMNPEEAEEFFRKWIDSKRLKAKFGDNFMDELESLVNDAIVAMDNELKVYGLKLNQGQYGKLMHEFLSDLVRAYYDDVPFVVRSESRLMNFKEIPKEVREMTVREFMGSDTRGLGRDFLDGRVGDKIPDLVLSTDDTIFVWDLTTRGRLAHQAKTLFLQKVFAEVPGKKVVAGESYYRYYRPNDWD